MSQYWARHNSVRDFLYNTLNQCGITVQKERPIEGKDRPADHFIPQWNQCANVCVDITVVNAFPPTITIPDLSNSGAANRAEESKVRRYAGIFQRPASRFRFIPCGFDSFGQPGKGASEFLHTLRPLVKDFTHSDAEEQSHPFFLSQVSAVLARTVGTQLVGMFHDPQLLASLESNRESGIPPPHPCFNNNSSITSPPPGTSRLFPFSTLMAAEAREKVIEIDG